MRGENLSVRVHVRKRGLNQSLSRYTDSGLVELISVSLGDVFVWEVLIQDLGAAKNVGGGNLSAPVFAGIRGLNLPHAVTILSREALINSLMHTIATSASCVQYIAKFTKI